MPQRRAAFTAQHWKRMPSCSKFERTYGPIKRDPLAAFRPVQSGNARILMPSRKSCPNICWWTATISSLRGMS